MHLCAPVCTCCAGADAGADAGANLKHDHKLHRIHKLNHMCQYLNLFELVTKGRAECWVMELQLASDANAFMKPLNKEEAQNGLKKDSKKYIENICKF